MSAEVHRAVPAVPEEQTRHIPEALTAAVAFALAAACFLHFGVTARAFISAVFVIFLVVLSVTDIERRVLPNRIVVPGTVIVLGLQLALFPEHALEWILASLGAGVFFLAACATYRAGLGLGDVKFALLLGAGLGKGVVLGVFIGLFASGIAGLIIVAREGLAARKKTIPLGPFLAFGAIISLFFNGSDFISF